jgi:hypothetical protein
MKEAHRFLADGPPESAATTNGHPRARTDPLSSGSKNTVRTGFVPDDLRGSADLPERYNEMREVNGTPVRAATLAERRGLALVDAVTSVEALRMVLDAMPAPVADDDALQFERRTQLAFARRACGQVAAAVESLAGPDVTAAAFAAAAVPPDPAGARARLAELVNDHALWLYGVEEHGPSLAQYRNTVFEVTDLALGNRQGWPTHLSWVALAEVARFLAPLSAAEIVGIIGGTGTAAYRAQMGR